MSVALNNKYLHFNTQHWVVAIVIESMALRKKAYKQPNMTKFTCEPFSD